MTIKSDITDITEEVFSDSNSDNLDDNLDIRMII